MFRPRGIAEWVWACGGAALLVALRLVSLPDAGVAIAGGADVYLFLTGMMLLAESARSHGVFAWLAARAVAASGGSVFRLFAIVYGVGTVVTVVLSNDATAIVLTPAVAVAVRRANVTALPFVFACAFIANAASFVLPISNPANLIVFAGGMPPLWVWLAAFLLPSVAAISVTFGVLAWTSRADLRGTIESGPAASILERGGIVAASGIVLSAVTLLLTSALRGPIGAVTFAAAVAVVVAGWIADRKSILPAVRAISWGILPLVAGLFVLVRGLESAGTIDALRAYIAPLASLPGALEIAAFGIGTALLANVTNNLPLGVIAGEALAHGHVAITARYAAAIGVDLGPNLSVTGSLATILWLVALRRENIEMNAARFLRVGMLVMPPALLAALAVLWVLR